MPKIFNFLKVTDKKYTHKKKKHVLEYNKQKNDPPYVSVLFFYSSYFLNIIELQIEKHLKIRVRSK